MNFAENSRKPARIWLGAAILLVVAVVLRWWNLGAITEKIFDEAHYVPAAEVLVGIQDHPGMGVWSFHPLIGKAPAPNFEHPLLGKFLIGWGMRLFGADAVGWRFFPALIGCLSLVLMGWLGFRFFGQPMLALLGLLFLGFDSLHMIHSRLAMLDIFLMTALLGLLLSSWELIQQPDSWTWRIAATLCIALGLSSKWVFAFGILAFSWCLLAMGQGSKKLRFQTWVIVGLMALGLYHLWFPYYAAQGFSYGEWLEFHIAANVVITGKLAHHPYGASALSMLFNQRNIWYHFQQLPGQMTVGLVGLVNPLLIFSVLPALTVCLVNYRKTRERQDIFILGWFACCYLPFFLVLRERQGFLYYMLLVLPLIILAVVRMLDILGKKIRFRVLATIYGLVFLGFAAFYLPVVLALPMTRDYYLWLIKFTGV
ncbi:phospholipid carrier-dependent glycosyltransferase [Oligoflexus tunisiensis]|uniref:phospholipid carrier-dependent glycosyltransferase n=1 Tax=Oligoflexus tunisiensis TaxID=708132 RepID=UPI00114CFDC9|nr:phospholipid carrier-dependent glycosyltransferase [Oligoflexus tunisiensis]